MTTTTNTTKSESTKSMYMIASELEGQRVFLKYYDHVTFTNKPGFYWLTESKANERLAELQEMKLCGSIGQVIENAIVTSVTEDEYLAMKSANPKVYIRAKGPLSFDQPKFKERFAKAAAREFGNPLAGPETTVLEVTEPEIPEVKEVKNVNTKKRDANGRFIKATSATEEKVANS